LLGGGLSRECYRHSRALLRALESTFIELFEEQVPALAEHLGVEPTAEAVLDYLDKHPEELTEERLAEVVKHSRVLGMGLSFVLPLFAKYKPTYEDLVNIARECGLENTYYLLLGFPNLSRKVVEHLNRMASKVRA
jgi:ABC-type Fe3+-hydroxamate transport system substrate-binding protein